MWKMSSNKKIKPKNISKNKTNTNLDAKALFNKNVPVCYKIIFSIIGLIGLVLSVLIYQKIYINGTKSFAEYADMAYCAVGMFVSFLLVTIIFNWLNKIFMRMLIIVGVLLLIAVIIFAPVRLITILFFVSLLVFWVIMSFKNVFSTVLTFLLCSLPVIFILQEIMKCCNSEKEENIVVYLGVFFYIFLYKMLGKSINRFFIGKCMGYSREADTYDDEQLKNQIQIIYLLIFIWLNVSYFIYADNTSNLGNLINNSFLTGITAIAVDWKRIWFHFTYGKIRKKIKQDIIQNVHNFLINHYGERPIIYIKFSKTKDYANDFRKGKLFLNSLDRIRKLDKNQEEKKRNIQEYNNLKLKFVSADMNLNNNTEFCFSDISYDVEFENEKNIKATCLIGLTASDFIVEKFENNVATLKLPFDESTIKEFEQNFGFFVTIIDGAGLRERLIKVYKNDKKECYFDKVEYIDTKHDWLLNINANKNKYTSRIFYKNYIFKNQKEYRLAILEENSNVFLKLDSLIDMMLV